LNSITGERGPNPRGGELSSKKSVFVGGDKGELGAGKGGVKKLGWAW